MLTIELGTIGRDDVTTEFFQFMVLMLLGGCAVLIYRVGMTLATISEQLDAKLDGKRRRR